MEIFGYNGNMNIDHMLRPARGLVFFAVLLVFTAIMSPLGADSTDAAGQTPVVTLDPAYDWSESVHLDGEWAFFWQEWIDPAKPAAELRVPDGVFKARTWPSQDYPLFGYASYRLVVESRSFPVTMGISFRGFYSAYRVFVNGTEIGHNGRLGMESASEIGKGDARYFYFSVPAGVSRLELVIHASNYSYNYRAGMLEGPWLGSQSEIAVKQSQRQALDILFIGSMLVMGVYHIFLTLFRRKDKAALFFGLFCLIMAYRTFFITGEKLAFSLLPWLTGRIFTFAQLPGIYLIMPLFLLYVYNLFRQDAHRRIVYLLLGVSGVLFIAGIISAPFKAIRFYNFVLVPGMVYILFVLFMAWIKNRPDARLIGSGFLVLFVLGINDILNDMKIIDTAYFLSNGLFLFLFFQSVVLARRFSRAFVQVEKLSAELESHNTELQKLDKLKDEFLANTSHELKTPLNGIIGLSESLVDGAGGPVSDAMKRNLELIVLSGRRLYSMVNDLLDFSRLKENQMTLDIVPVDIRSVCNLVLALSENIVPEGKNLTILNELPPDVPGVLADPSRLEQIVFNLVANAVKFTEAGYVRLKASWTDHIVTVSIEDTGIGIPEDKQELVFESFQQADSSISRRFGGSGLGLAIVKKLLLLHGGDISLRSRPGEGSCFSFTLPRAPEHSALIPNSVSHIRANKTLGNSSDIIDMARIQQLQAAAVPALPAAAARSLTEIPLDVLNGQHIDPNAPARLQGTILVVDDEYINLTVLINNLTLFGYTIVSASSGAEALRLIERHGKPDAVILDIMMPDMSGYELTRELRKQFTASQLPVILLTARNQSTDIVEGFNCGANDYLTKPFSRTELIARVKTHIDLARINISYSRFVPSEFLGILNKNSIIDIKLGEQVEKNIAVLFTDIHSFSDMAESLSAAEIFNFINSYLGRFGPVVRRNRGFVDKYVGDAILAIFPEGSADALAAAHDMRQELNRYNSFRQKSGYQPIEFGIGIHSGPVIMGTVGETEHMETTVISDIVSVASRLEALTGMLNSPVLTVRGSVPDDCAVPRRFIGEVPVRVGHKTVQVMEIFMDLPQNQSGGHSAAPQSGQVAVDETDQRIIQKAKLDTLPVFQRGLEKFQNKDFAAAEELFTAVLAENPVDRIADLYAQRCRLLAGTKSLPENWAYITPEWVD